MEPLSTAAAAATVDFSVFSLYAQAHFLVKAIMITLLLMSVFTWAVLFHKYKVFKRLNRMANRFEEAFWRNEGLEGLYKDVKPEDTDHPMAMLFVLGRQEWERARDKEGELHGIIQIGVTERIRNLLYARMNRELDSLEKGLPFLATVGSTAPFIGLFGTVWGIMNAFQSIGAAKNTSLAIVAPGIAEALLATAVGLFAAIPAVMAYNKLSTLLSGYSARLDSFVGEFTSVLDRNQQETIIKAKKTSGRRRASDKK